MIGARSPALDCVHAMGFLTRKDPIAILTNHLSSPRHEKDTRSMMELAGLLAKKGDTAGAIDWYLRAAKEFLADGFHPKASAAAKQALQLSPKNIEANEFLCELYEKMKLKEDQRGVLKKLVDLYFENRDTEKVASTRKRLEALGPGR